MERAASIEVVLCSGDTQVRRFVRVCPEDAAHIRQMAEHATGWLQAWAAQLSDEQWAMDIRSQQREVA